MISVIHPANRVASLFRPWVAIGISTTIHGMIPYKILMLTAVVLQFLYKGATTFEYKSSQ
jgi:hypothetical protein